MSLSFDTKVTFTGTTSTSVTPTAGGSNVLLLIFATDSGTLTCTVDGSAATAIGALQNRPGSGAYDLGWYVNGVTAGSAHTVTFNFNCSGTILVYTGVHASAPIENHLESTSSTSSLSMALTPANIGEWGIGFFDYTNGSPSLTNLTTRDSGAGGIVGDSNGPITQNVSFSISCTTTGFNNISGRMVLLNAAPAPTIIPSLGLMGVGQ